MKQTTLCHIQRGNEYLMLHRVKKKNDMNHDKWIAVGGKLEEGETPDQCMLREVKEETGLDITSYKYRGLVHFVSDIYEDEDMHIYTADGYEGDIKECDEGNLEWIDRDALLDMPLWEGDKLFLALLKTDVEYFELTVCYKGEKLVGASINGQKIF